MRASSDIKAVTVISAGKLRRYPNQTRLQKIFDIQTALLNVRDVFRTLRGCIQAVRALGKIKPDIIFVKGGFVGVPVGIAAHIKRLPFITHDSDTKPGLANRIISRWAVLHAVGMPSQYYTYPAQKTVHVGIPLIKDYKHVTDKLKTAYRHDLSIPAKSKVITVTGGSQGAARLNHVFSKIVPELLTDNSVYILHQTGKLTEGLPPASTHYQRFEYHDDLYKVTGAADVVIARAGASTLAELAAQGKATIIVPSPYLASGHQLQNAQLLEDNRAGIVLDEKKILDNPTILLDSIRQLLGNADERDRLGKNLSSLYLTDSAKRISELILNATASNQ